MPMRIPSSFLRQSQDPEGCRGGGALVPEDPRCVLLEWSRFPPIISVNTPLVVYYQEKRRIELLVTHKGL